MEIIKYLNKYDQINNSNFLEFGCGDGFQFPIPKMTSNNVYAIVVSLDQIIKNKYLNIVSEQSIDKIFFKNNQFDLVCSNHVIEHLEDLQGAVKETQSKDSDEYIYEFSVPTKIWLILSVPAQYFRKIKHLINNFFNDKTDTHINKNSYHLVSKVMPKGHGESHGFIDCYKAFRIKSWRKLFKSLGFNAIKVEPLLLYSAFEFPIFPTTGVLSKLNICSGLLFILKINK